MPTHMVVFNVLLAGMCVYALHRGGGPEQLAALGWAVGCVATLMLPFDPTRTYHGVRWEELAIDSAVLVLFVAVAVAANRFWPMWLAATHLLAVAVHGVKAYEPDLLPAMYAFAVGKISYPMLLIIVVGIARHQGRLRAYGAERDWSVPQEWAA